VPSPLLHDGRLYWVDDGGIAFAADAATGELVYRERLGGAFYASVVRVGELLYAVSREGGTYVYPVGPDLDVLASNRIESDGTSFDATPAASGGRLFLRSRKALYCIAEDQEGLAGSRARSGRRYRVRHPDTLHYRVALADPALDRTPASSRCGCAPRSRAATGASCSAPRGEPRAPVCATRPSTGPG